jgi:hypothetical protein
VNAAITQPTRHRQIAEVENGRYAVEKIGGGALGSSLHKHMVEATEEAEQKGWRFLGIHGLGHADVYLLWDKTG